MDNSEHSRIRSFTDLVAWQRSHELALLIYKVTKSFPSEERYALTDQLRRASVSVTSNLAEGFSRNTSKDKAQFYTMAIGSIYELQSQLILAKDLGYIHLNEFNNLSVRAVNAAKLCNKLKSSAYKLEKFNPHLD